jgi:hypothetical protein
MSRKSLELITDQIDRLPDSEPLKEAIQDHARRADVESWLHGFLEKRRRVEL